MSKISERVAELAQKNRERLLARREERRRAVVDNERFGSRARRARGLADKTIHEMAVIIGCNTNHLGQIERDNTTIDDKIAFIRGIVEAYGGTFEIRFPGED
jgi:hypothetical protein